jgi:hypothetical protein
VVGQQDLSLPNNDKFHWHDVPKHLLKFKNEKQNEQQGIYLVINCSAGRFPFWL